MTYDSEFGSHVTLYKNRIKQVIDEALNEHLILTLHLRTAFVS